VEFHEDLDGRGPGYREHLATFGMTLRDYFAAKAIAGCLAAWYAMDGNQQSAQRNVWYSEYDEELSVNDCISADAYALADAMIKAREQ